MDRKGNLPGPLKEKEQKLMAFKKAKKIKKMEEATPELEMEESNAPAASPPPIQDVQPQPVPVSFRVGQVQAGEGGSGSLVQLLVFTPTGQQVLFLDPSIATALAEALFKVGEVARDEAAALVDPEEDEGE